MALRVAYGALAGCAAVIAAVIVLGNGDDDRYSVRLKLDNAGGLRSGSPVVVGGIGIGEVALELVDDVVVADLKIDPKYAPLGKDAEVSIAAQNVLGQKQVQVHVGSRGNPAPDGYVLPRRQVTQGADLDQVLAVLDADTRARLAILVNEVGAAVTGRRSDIRTFAANFPAVLERATRMLADVTADNRALRNLLTRSDGFVNEVTRQRRDLSRLVDRVGQTAVTVSARRTDLRATLADAPATLAALQAFLGDLEATAMPLGSAGRKISATAPALASTLDRIEPFRRSAAPALAAARDVAPELSRLSRGATPVLRRARPTLASLRSVSAHALPKVSETLDLSADNIFATVENWSRAIQFRDKLGHVFRGEAGVSPDMFLSIVDMLTQRRGPDRRPARRRPDAALPRPAQAGPPPAQPTDPVTPIVKSVPSAVQKVLDALIAPPVKKTLDDARSMDDSNNLLDYLLGP